MKTPVMLMPEGALKSVPYRVFEMQRLSCRIEKIAKIVIMLYTALVQCRGMCRVNATNGVNDVELVRETSQTSTRIQSTIPSQCH